MVARLKTERNLLIYFNTPALLSHLCINRPDFRPFSVIIGQPKVEF